MTIPPQELKQLPIMADESTSKESNCRSGVHSSSMQLTRAADYGLRAMIHLASLPDTERALLPQMARATSAPESFLSKVLQSLCKAGFAKSHRGQSGGFEILPSGRCATISAIIQAIEGPVSLNVCTGRDAPCSRKHFCPAHPVWLEAQAAMLAVLNARTITELAESASALAHPARR